MGEEGRKGRGEERRGGEEGEVVVRERRGNTMSYNLVIKLLNALVGQIRVYMLTDVMVLI